MTCRRKLYDDLSVRSKDYERTTSSSEAMIKVSAVHLMLHRLRPDANAKVAKFTYKSNPMKNWHNFPDRF